MKHSPMSVLLSTLLKSDKLDAAITNLHDLRAKMDSSFGGNSSDDIISSPSAQKEIVPMIDNLIGVLEKQK